MTNRGPRAQPAPWWVPQLQLHMLCAGTWSGLLLVRSATQGGSVWRMWRDQEYCARLLRLVKKLYCDYVLRGRAPPPNVFASEPGYAAFLEHTVRLARNCQLVTSWSGLSPAPDGVDDRAML
ncbi:hypothetical protein V8C86DRAFT_2796579 [Haematococcus lacustris]